MKIFIWLGVLVVLLVGVILSLPFLVDLTQYQDQYKPLIEASLNRKMALQDIRLTIWPRVGVRLAGVTVQEDPAFGSGPFASLTSLDIGVKLMPLLSRKIEVEEITLRDPFISVIKNSKGELNLSTLGAATQAAPSSMPEPSGAPAPSTGNPLQWLALLAVDRVSLTGGAVLYRDDSAPEPTVYRVNDLEVLLKSVHLGETPTLHLAATLLPDNIPLTIDGSFGPLVDLRDVKQFGFDLGLGKMAMALKGRVVDGNLMATVTIPQINSSDLPMAVPLTKPVQIQDVHVTVKASYPGPQGVPAEELVEIQDLGMTLAMGQSLLAVTGHGTGSHFTVGVAAPSLNTADLPVELSLRKPLEIKAVQLSAEFMGRDIRVNNLSMQLFGGTVKAIGLVTAGGLAPPFHGKVTVEGLQLGPALEALGSSQISASGTAGFELAVSGRGFALPDLAKALEATGHIGISQGRIEGVNLIQEAVTRLHVPGLTLDNPKATVFSTAETDLVVKDGIINIQRLLMDSHDFQATGGGTVGFDQSLNLKFALQLSEPLSQKIVRSLSVTRLALAGGRLNVPVTIAGTTQAPSYGVDVNALTGKVQSQVKEQLKGAIGEVLGGSSNPQDLQRKGRDLLKGLLGK